MNQEDLKKLLEQFPKGELCKLLVKKFNLDFGAIVLQVQNKNLVSVKVSRTLRPENIDVEECLQS